jgi:uncharacterized membrane protein YkvA (DUF1232 family)
MDASTFVLVGLAVLVVVLIAVLVVAIVFFTRLVRLYAVVRDPRMPTSGKVAFWVAAIYAVFPIDVLPDPVYLDDAGVLAFAVAFVTNLARKHGIRVGQVTSRESGPDDRPARR